MPISIKTPEQIEGIRKSCHLAAATLAFLGRESKAGISTEYLNQLAETYICDHGATPAPLNYLGYPKSICTSINEVICHGIPKDEDILQNGDILNIDITTNLNGYYGDTSSMFAIGNISTEASNLLTIANNCLNLGIDQVKPYNCFGMIGKIISRYARSKGYSAVYQFCGHGTGLQFHEEPQIFFDERSKFDFTVMYPGMVFTVEPMICSKKPDAVILEDGWTAVTKDGGLSAQYEHTILVTTTGYEILTLVQ